VHHIHFLVDLRNNFEVNGQRQAPVITGQYADMIEVPGWGGNPEHPHRSVSLRMDFRRPNIGNFVFHSHILEHEDGEMMSVIQVVPATAKESDQKALPDGGGL
jgi:FtsP/CotA-like multicopper oxidase with cupredoxin domain